jgi:RND family efflux transporter MFP subunit
VRIAGLALTGVVLLGAGCGRSRGTGDETAAQAVVRVTTVVAEAGTFTEYVSALGTVSPRPGRYAELAAPAPTRVARIVARPGAFVQEGDTLIVFERAPFDAAARTAEAALSTAEHAADRATRLVQAGILPKKDADQAAQALAEAQAAAITARRNQELAALRAPLSGVVTRMTAVLGAAVDASQPLVAVADPRALDVLLTLTPAEAARVHPGDSVAVSAGEDIRGAAEPIGVGRVSDVAGAVDSTTRSVAARVRLPHPSRALRLGESVFGRIAVARRARTIVVPVSALVPAGEGFQVFVVDSAGIAHARSVDIGARTETLVEVLRGLVPGETVVASGAYGVTDGARVERAPT